MAAARGARRDERPGWRSPSTPHPLEKGSRCGLDRLGVSPAEGDAGAAAPVAGPPSMVKRRGVLTPAGEVPEGGQLRDRSPAVDVAAETGARTLVRSDRMMSERATPVTASLNGCPHRPPPCRLVGLHVEGPAVELRRPGRPRTAGAWGERGLLRRRPPVATGRRTRRPRRERGRERETGPSPSPTHRYPLPGTQFILPTRRCTRSGRARSRCRILGRRRQGSPPIRLGTTGILAGRLGGRAVSGVAGTATRCCPPPPPPPSPPPPPPPPPPSWAAHGGLLRTWKSRDHRRSPLQADRNPTYEVVALPLTRRRPPCGLSGRARGADRAPGGLDPGGGDSATDARDRGSRPAVPQLRGRPNQWAGSSRRLAVSWWRGVSAAPAGRVGRRCAPLGHRRVPALRMPGYAGPARSVGAFPCSRGSTLRWCWPGRSLLQAAMAGVHRWLAGAGHRTP
jgi:hypothetical protein